MKRTVKTAASIALAIAASFSTAHAGTVASINLVDDGHLDLMDVAFPQNVSGIAASVRQACAGERVAKAWGNADDSYGCWTGDGEGHVVVTYTSDYIVLGSHTYTINNSMITAYGRQRGWSVR